jgi:hypothetical protein
MARQMAHDGKGKVMNETLKTFRRDKLRRLIQAGRVFCVSSYHFDDMTGESRSRERKPVALGQGIAWQDRTPGTVYLWDGALSTGSGSCYTRGEDRSRVTLIVHSNSSYEFEVA